MRPSRYIEFEYIKFMRRLIEATVPNDDLRHFDKSEIFEFILDGVPSECLASDVKVIATKVGDSLKDVRESAYFYARHLARLSRAHPEINLEMIEVFDRYCPLLDDTHFDCPTRDAIEELSARLGLAPEERDMLILCYGVTNSDGICKFLSTMGLEKPAVMLRYLPAILDISKRRAVQLLHRRSRLFQIGLLTNREHSTDIELTQQVTDYLLGFSEGDFFDVFTESCDLSTVKFPLTVDQTQYDLARSMLERHQSIHLLVYGAAGTGKTTLAKKLCQDLGLKLVAVPTHEKQGIVGKRAFDRRDSLSLIAEMLRNSKDTVILVDEADVLLQTRTSWLMQGKSGDKAWLNTFLETCGSRVIWITNSIWGVEESTLRRFGYTLEFRPTSRAKRLDVWQRAMDKYPDLAESVSTADLELLAQRYELSAGPIMDSCARINMLGVKADEVLPALQTVLKGYMKSMGRSEVRASYSRVDESYSIDALSTSVSVREMTGRLERFVEDAPEEVRNYNLLLSGPPGTGKTEFVKYLAKQLKLDLVVKRASDIKSPYVGVTEKNIARAFEEAAGGQTLLFFDEVDSLLGQREHADRQWQVSQTNELLCQMENFRGIFVCATNLPENIDRAAFRRFSEKVVFDYLGDKGKEELFRRMIISVTGKRLLGRHREGLRKLGMLTPGDFRLVRKQLVLGYVVDNDEALRLLRAEAEAKVERGGRRIGY